jgi:sulfite exporter TauE/SafE
VIATIAAGVLLGGTGSAHCVAMCGPLVTLAAPRGVRAVLHHAGRITSYVLLGVAAGSVGEMAAWAGLARWLAFGVAGWLLAKALLDSTAVPSFAWPARLASRCMPAIARLRERHAAAAAVLLGMLNGLLPCGMVYVAAATAAGWGHAGQGALFMAAFGVGTSPLLLAVAAGAQAAGSMMPARLRRFAPVALAVVALVLVWRGLTVPGGPAASHH